MENRSAYQLSQRREGANSGGLYYLFEVLGLEVVLLANRGEVATPERDDYSLYLIVGRSGDTATNLAVATHICGLAEAASIDACVDSLSS